MKKTILVAAAGAAIAIGIAGGVLGRWAHSCALVAHHAIAHPSESDGLQHRWSVEIDVGIRSSDGSTQEATALAGEWVETITGTSAEGTEVACEFAHAHVVGKRAATVDPKAEAELEARMAQRIWVTVQPDGAVTRMHFPKDMDDPARNMLQLIMTTKQFARPQPLPTQWVTSERDGAGMYMAQYVRTAPDSPSGPTEVLKRKMRYVALDGVAGGPGLELAIDDSNTVIELDARGQIDELRAHEASHLDGTVGPAAFGMDIRLALDHRQTGRAPELVGSLERAGSSVETGPVVTQRLSDEALRARNDARLVAGVSLDDVLGAVRAGQLDSKTRSKLEALLRLHEHAVAPTLRVARDAAPETKAFLLDALGAAGTSSAQAALRSVAANQHVEPAERKAAMIALVRTTRPDEATLDAFEQLIQIPDPSTDASSRRQLLFTAGALAHAGSEAHPDAAARIAATLARRYARCEGDDCTVFLNALGNVGNGFALPTIKDALASSSPARRAAAVDALRLVHDPSADRWIVERITSDADPKVRAAAVGTARYRPLGPLVEALSRAVESDPADSVRMQAIDVLSEHLTQSPAVERAFIAAADHDPSPGVRRLAREGLDARTRSR
jgi:hypothetical protein